MFERLLDIEKRYVSVAEELASPEVYGDPQRAAELAREQKRLRPIVEAFRAYRAAREARDEAEELLSSGESDLYELAREQLAESKAALDRLEGELRVLLGSFDDAQGRDITEW